MTNAVTTPAGVQSFETGLKILEILLQSNQPMMLKEISEAAQMHPAKVHRYLVSLIRAQFAIQNQNGHYVLSSHALSMMLHAIRDYDQVQSGMSHIMSFYQDVKECVQISRWSALGPLITHFFEPISPISLSAKVGAIMPLVISATGRVFASYMPENIIRPMMDKEWQAAKDNNAVLKPSSWDEFVPIKDKILKDKICIVKGDFVSGINALSAPVLDAQDNIIYVITCLGPADKIASTLDGPQVQALRQTIQQITVELG